MKKLIFGSLAVLVLLIGCERPADAGCFQRCPPSVMAIQPVAACVQPVCVQPVCVQPVCVQPAPVCQPVCQPAQLYTPVTTLRWGFFKRRLIPRTTFVPVTPVACVPVAPVQPQPEPPTE